MAINKRIFSTILMILLVFILYEVSSHLIKERHICLIKNISASLPFSYFFGFRIEEPKRGTYVAFHHPKAECLVVKRITGVPGDEISVKDSEVYVNNIFQGVVKNISPSGMILSPIEEGKIPENYVFVHGSHPASFDSRYAEFGLVAISQLKERVWPLF